MMVRKRPDSAAIARRYYAEPGPMSSLGPFGQLLEGLPDDLPSLVRAVQGVVTYDVVFPRFYGHTLPDERLAEIHLRQVDQMLARVRAMDDQPLSVARAPDRRLLGRCRHYTLLLVAILRAKGVPARARVGFGRYFGPELFEDHWVCEYWDKARHTWTLVDPQMDELWKKRLELKIDAFNVPRDQFLVAADAWGLCRSGKVDTSRFGISFVGLHGLWFVADNLLRDLAALNKVEVLPWDSWGGHLRPNDRMTDELLPFFDRIAALTREPDRSFEKLRQVYDSDERCRVPPFVFNGELERVERI